MSLSNIFCKKRLKRMIEICPYYGEGKPAGMDKGKKT
jgi:hypothetical protein